MALKKGRFVGGITGIEPMAVLAIAGSRLFNFGIQIQAWPQNGNGQHHVGMQSIPMHQPKMLKGGLVRTPLPV